MNQDSRQALLQHRNIIRKKPFLYKIYVDFYKTFLKTKFPKGAIVEIGSGAGFVKDIIPNVTTSDLIKGPDIDKVFSAHKIPFENESVSVFLMVNVLHHIKHSEKALQEIERCLIPKGKIVMIEPYSSLWGGLIFKYIHPEKKGFNPKAGWKIKGRGRMSDSNPALPWIIFVRDRKIFQKKFPNLKIVEVLPHTPFGYLISGGLTKYQFLPTSTYPLIRWFDNFISKLFPQISMFVTIKLEKTRQA